jgi:hypothetical protein
VVKAPRDRTRHCWSDPFRRVRAVSLNSGSLCGRRRTLTSSKWPFLCDAPSAGCSITMRASSTREGDAQLAEGLTQAAGDGVGADVHASRSLAVQALGNRAGDGLLCTRQGRASPLLACRSGHSSGGAGCPADEAASAHAPRRGRLPFVGAPVAPPSGSRWPHSGRLGVPAGRQGPRQPRPWPTGLRAPPRHWPGEPGHGGRGRGHVRRPATGPG